MTTNTRTLLFDSTVSTAFRTWGSNVAAMLGAVGLIQTADTGQISWTTASITAGTSTEYVQGFEIWRFSDTLQSTKPVFIKMEYGHTNGSGGVNNVGAPVLYVTVGTTSDGAGNLGGTISVRTRLSGGGHSTNTCVTPTVSSPCFASGDGSYINLALGVTSNAQAVFTTSPTASVPFPAMLVVDRIRDGAGAATGNGVIFLTSKWPVVSLAAAPSTIATTYQVLSFTGSGASTQEALWPISYPGQGFASSSSGTTYGVWPMPVSSPDPTQSLAVLGLYKGEAAVGAIVSLTMLGSSHTYLAMGGISGTAAGDATRGHVNTFVPSGAPLIRYE